LLIINHKFNTAVDGGKAKKFSFLAGYYLKFIITCTVYKNITKLF